MYARNVKGLTLQNVRLEYDESDARPAMVFDNVHDCSVTGLAVQGSSGAESVLRFTRSSDVLLSATRVLSACPVFLRLEGSENEGIMVDGGDLRKTAKLLAYEAGATEKAVRVRV